MKDVGFDGSPASRCAARLLDDVIASLGVGWTMPRAATESVQSSVDDSDVTKVSDPPRLRDAMARHPRKRPRPAAATGRASRRPTIPDE